MKFIKWDEKIYGVGVKEIDLQHQELFRILNRMLSILGMATEKEIKSILDNMVDYTSFHFKTEENYYKDHPDFEQHLHEHDIFIKKNAQLKQSIEESDQEIGQEILNFLLKWLKNHILKTDIRFFNEMKEVGQ